VFHSFPNKTSGKIDLACQYKILQLIFGRVVFIRPLTFIFINYIYCYIKDGGNMRKKFGKYIALANTVIRPEVVEQKIFLLRGIKVMLDKDLALLYGVDTRNLNKAVKRNIDRFPLDFMFQLKNEEFKSLMFQFGTSNRGGTRKLPYAFTEQGVAMLSSVLHSKRAVQVNIAIMRVFVRIKELVPTYHKLISRVKTLEKKHLEHDKDLQGHEEDIQDVFLSIDQLQSKQEELEIKIDQTKDLSIKKLIRG
jgi:hypothetical protein